MALTYGFYNSYNGDRRYDAIQHSSVFDGIIRDGIFMSIGTSMMVKAAGGMMATIGIGRAWFDHTWTLNDAEYPVNLDQPEILQDRIDTIVLEVNSQVAVRANSYKVIKGTPATNPVPPTLIQSLSVNQYALCDIRVRRGVTSINQADIANRVGTGRAPFVTGLLDVINIDALVAQWGDQWRQFYDAQTIYMVNTTEALLQQWLDFYSTQTTDMLATNEQWKNQWRSWYDAMTSSASLELANWRIDREGTFDAWFADLQNTLDENQASNLFNKIDNHERSGIADNNDGVHNLRLNNGRLQTFIPGLGWATLATVPFGFTGEFFDAQNFTGISFDLREFTGYTFDNVIRVEVD